jgi:hypothetical protein
MFAARAADERKVDAASVGIGVTHVRHHERVTGERAADTAVHRVELRPRRRDFHRVVPDAGAEHGGLLVTHRVAPLEPCARGTFAERFAAFARDDAGGVFDLLGDFVTSSLEHEDELAFFDERAFGRVDSDFERARHAEQRSHQSAANGTESLVTQARFAGFFSRLFRSVAEQHGVEWIVETRDCRT